MYQEKRPRRGAKRLGAAIAAVCTLLLLLGVWAVWNGAQAAMREQAAQSLRTAVLDAAVQCCILRGHTRRVPIWKKLRRAGQPTAGLSSAANCMHRTSCRPSPCWKSRRHDSLRRGIRQNEGRRRSEKTRSVLDASVSAASVCHHRAVAAVPCDDGDRALQCGRGQPDAEQRGARGAVISCRAGACGDAAGAVSVGEGPEGAALLLRENADGETYETRIYLYEGALREEYGTADAALDPQDSERIVDAKSFSIEQVRPGLLVVSTEYGSADIALRSGRGTGPDA